MIVNESVSQYANPYFEGAKIVKRIGVYSDNGANTFAWLVKNKVHGLKDPLMDWPDRSHNFCESEQKAIYHCDIKMILLT
ncbi:hypothetical protein SD10_21400 [Spirosoma radiotolerans]|uniref:Uncharacterized protein n=1 Tax=Spirosoma radiotolerans TaxID=1379870 RepID=A0A0E3V8T7_9BACT|nr:hypothetical protein SD10_21400 [Spirosoma radiotolerans]